MISQLFEVLSKSFQEVAFIYKSRMSGSTEVSSFSLMALVIIALINYTWKIDFTLFLPVSIDNLITAPILCRFKTLIINKRLEIERSFNTLYIYLPYFYLNFKLYS